MGRNVRFTCPICHRKVERNSSFFPFCSERCKLIDLGKWAGEEYRIKGEYSHSIPEDRASDN
jgi:hypothetical protein